MKCLHLRHIIWIQFVTQTLFLFQVAPQAAAAAEFQWNQLAAVHLDAGSGGGGAGPATSLATPADVPSDTGFVQLQVHLGPDQPPGWTLSVSTRPDFGPLYTATGRHTGLIALNASTASWYLRLDNLTEAAPAAGNATAWVAFVAKAWDEPIPGGCDLTSPVANPPGLTAGPLSGSSGTAWRLGYALADSFDARHRVKLPCNASLRRANLRYRLYAMELSSPAAADWLAGLRRMATAQEAVAYGRLIFVDGDEGEAPRAAHFDVAGRPSVAVIYSLVVEQTDTGQFSAYVPVTLDDQCGGVDGVGPEDLLARCVLSVAIEWRVATIVATLLGLFLCVAGFRFFSLSVLICGFATGCLIGLPITLRTMPAAAFQQQQWLAYLLGAGLAGALLALAGLSVWLKCKSTALALLFVHAPCCYLLACVAFTTPFGRLWWVMREEYIFFMTLLVLLLLSLLVLLLFSHAGAIFSLSLVGTFAATVCVSANLLVGSMFPYIFLDLFRRTAIPGYNRVHLVFALHHAADWILLSAWLAAALLCCLLQYCWNRRAMDPALRRRRRPADDDGDYSGGGVGGDERTPLLRADAGRRSPPPGYTVIYASTNSS